MDKTLASSQSVFVLELVSAGYFGDDIHESFRREGWAMLDAVLADFRCIPGVTVETLIDHAVDGIRETLLRSVAKIRADVTLIIAPEFDALLEHFCTAVRRPKVMPLNCDLDSLQICSDKWRFARHLTAHGIPTVSTEVIDVAAGPTKFPCVVKPRFGAGSWLVRFLGDHHNWLEVAESYQQAGLHEALSQPPIVGRALSVGALLRRDHSADILPIADQRLSSDGEFRYLGGEIPAKLSAGCEERVRQLVTSVIHSLPGLNGYIGCDVIVPDDHPCEPVLVELNPRLTTSYIGYRKLCEDNLMARLLFPDRKDQPLRWKRGTVSFDADGTCRYAGP